MDEYELIDALLRIQYKLNDNEMPKNEKLFLSSIGFSLHDLINNNELHFSIDYYSDNNIIKSYMESNVKHLIEIYNILGEQISVGKLLDEIVEGKIKRFDYVKDPIKIFYRDYLTENEKIHSINLLNELPNTFLIKSVYIEDLRRNINELYNFFKLMYYITDGMFRYNENVAQNLVDTNNYILRKAFFNSLVYVLNDIKNYDERDRDIRLIFFDNIETLLSKASEEFNEAMAKKLIK